jgi:acyl transferase domain-containing protein
MKLWKMVSLLIPLTNYLSNAILAGVPIESVVGSSTSCYVGCFTQDYHNMMSHDPENFPAYFPTGVAAACLSNRVSWFYDLRGPSMTIDTACSSSLVALHLACQSLRTGESTMVGSS